MIPIIRLFK